MLQLSTLTQVLSLSTILRYFGSKYCSFHSTTFILTALVTTYFADSDYYTKYNQLMNCDLLSWIKLPQAVYKVVKMSPAFTSCNISDAYTKYNTMI